ncbi:MAG: serine/threonine-protein kinase [Halioglobus sp.]
MHASVQVGPYQVLRLIKSGGQGRVFLAYDTRLQRKVALKLMPLLHGSKARSAQLQEARMLASINSERIVEIYDRVVSRHVMALVMEYVPGCDLEELLVDGGLPVSFTLAIAADVAAALAVVRQAGIVHRDLKASNVLVSCHGRAKLTDFGIANSSDSAIGNNVAGSLSALSPEQIRGDPTDVRSDLFALGCLIYRMLTGLHPFVLQGRLDVDAVLAGRYLEIARVLPEVEANAMPAGLVSLVDDLLQAPVELRPQNTHEVRRRLREISRDLPLALHSSVTDVAAPFFRAETPGELPPDIPLELIETGRSYGPASNTIKFESPRSYLILTSLVFALVLVMILVSGVRSGLFASNARDIEIMDPQLLADDSAQRVLQIYPDAIRQTIAASIREEAIGTVFGVAESDDQDTAFSTQLPAEIAVADERIVSRIECQSQLCILVMQRVVDSATESPVASFQLAVFADASHESWQTAIEQGLKALYSP